MIASTLGRSPLGYPGPPIWLLHYKGVADGYDISVGGRHGSAGDDSVAIFIKGFRYQIHVYHDHRKQGVWSRQPWKTGSGLAVWDGLDCCFMLLPCHSFRTGTAVDDDC